MHKLSVRLQLLAAPYGTIYLFGLLPVRCGVSHDSISSIIARFRHVMIHPHILGLNGRTFSRSMVSSSSVAAAFIISFTTSNIHKRKLLAATSIPANITIPAPSKDEKVAEQNRRLTKLKVVAGSSKRAWSVSQGNFTFLMSLLLRSKSLKSTVQSVRRRP